jgi:hypothetical protein
MDTELRDEETHRSDPGRDLRAGGRRPSFEADDPAVVPAAIAPPGSFSIFAVVPIPEIEAAVPVFELKVNDWRG